MSEGEIETKSSALDAEICALHKSISTTEAAHAADVAVRYPLELALQYRATPPAIVNNVLINMGIHPRGLCYQWADDLTAKLMSLHLRTIELHRGVAALATPREHSCVVITAPGQCFEEGIVLDAWRNCGYLAWAVVKKDKFKWKEVLLREHYQNELDAAAKKLEKSGSQEP